MLLQGKQSRERLLQSRTSVSLYQPSRSFFSKSCYRLEAHRKLLVARTKYLSHVAAIRHSQASQMHVKMFHYSPSSLLMKDRSRWVTKTIFRVALAWRLLAVRRFLHKPLQPAPCQARIRVEMRQRLLLILNHRR